MTRAKITAGLVALAVACGGAISLRADDDDRRWGRGWSEDRWKAEQKYWEEVRKADEKRREELRKLEERRWEEARRLQERQRRDAERAWERARDRDAWHWERQSQVAPRGYEVYPPTLGRDRWGDGFYAGGRYEAIPPPPPQGYYHDYDARYAAPPAPAYPYDPYYGDAYYPSRGTDVGARIGARIGGALFGPEGAAIGAGIGGDIGAEVERR